MEKPRSRGGRIHSQVVNFEQAATELYLAMVYGHVGTRDTYQPVRLSASTYCIGYPCQRRRSNLGAIMYLNVFYFKFDHRRLNGYTICTSTQSDRLVCVPGAYTTIDHS